MRSALLPTAQLQQHEAGTLTWMEVLAMGSGGVAAVASISMTLSLVRLVAYLIMALDTPLPWASTAWTVAHAWRSVRNTNRPWARTP